MVEFTGKLLAALLIVCPLAFANGAEIVFIAPTSLSMPWAEFESGQLHRGALKDLGDAIAERLNLRPRYVSSPSKRVGLMLAGGEADCVCDVTPRRMAGEFNWSRPFLTADIMLVARADAPVIRSLVDLANQPVGTISGYRYPEIERPLGELFLRDDAPSADSIFKKLAANRTRYAIVDQSEAIYRMSRTSVGQLRPEFKIGTLATQCAFSLKSRIPFAMVNSALESLIVDGSVERILALQR